MNLEYEAVAKAIAEKERGMMEYLSLEERL